MCILHTCGQVASHLPSRVMDLPVFPRHCVHDSRLESVVGAPYIIPGLGRERLRRFETWVCPKASDRHLHARGFCQAPAPPHNVKQFPATRGDVICSRVRRRRRVLQNHFGTSHLISRRAYQDEGAPTRNDTPVARQSTDRQEKLNDGWVTFAVSVSVCLPRLRRKWVFY